MAVDQPHAPEGPRPTPAGADGAGGRSQALAQRVEELEARVRELEERLAEARERNRALRRARRSLRRRLARAEGRDAGSASSPPAAGAIRTLTISLPSLAGERAAAPKRLALSAPARYHIPRRLERRGLARYEPDGLACFLAMLESAPPGAALDVGANIGVYGALASALTDREVWAFEPAPEVAEVASSFAAENELGLTVEQLALGAENGTATLYVAAASDTSSSLAEGFRAASTEVQVPVETLDSWCERTGVRPAVVKIDTETTEPDVIAGARQTLAAHRPWLLCEVLAGRVEERLAQALAPLGYRWFHVRGEPPYPERDRIEGDRSYEHLMWLFCPEPPDEGLWDRIGRMRRAISECGPEPQRSGSQPSHRRQADA